MSAFTEDEGHERDPLTQAVIGCAIEVHRELGPGLFESTYEKCLVHELKLAGLDVEAQVPITIEYKGMMLDCGYRADLLVESQLIIELKSVEQILKIHEAQLVTYLELGGRSAGLLINFNVTQLKNGIRRLFRSRRRELGFS